MPTNNTPLHLLMVEDVEDDAAFIVGALERGNFAVSPRRVETAEALRAALEGQSWDLLTADHTLPQFSALAALALARALRPDLPVIVVSDEISQSLAVELLRAGARDYIRKDDLATLPLAADRELRSAAAERQRRQAEAALRESEARWQYALEGAGEGVWDWNLQTGEIFFSKQWKALLGYAEDEVITLAAWEAMVHPDDHAHVMANDPALHAGRTSTVHGEYRIRCKDGAYKWILDHGKVISYTPDGKPLRAIGTQTDITGRKLAEAELRRLKEFNEGIVQGLAEGIIVHDAEGRCAFANVAAGRILGHAPEELQGQDWHSVVSPDQYPRVQATLEHRRAGFKSQYETEVIRPDGRRVPVRVSGTPRFENGQYAGSLVVFADLTEQKQVMDQLQASEAKFRSVAENAPWGMHFYRLGADGRLVLTGANPAADAILNLSHAGLAGQSLEDAFPQFAGTEIPRHFRQVAEHGGDWRIEQIGYVNGQMASAYAVRAFQIAPGQLVAVFENILEHKRADEIIQTQADILHSQNQELRLQNQELIAQGEAFHRAEIELRASEEKYHTLVDITDTGYVILDGAGRVLDANSEYVRLTGRQNLAELLGRPVTEWTAPHDQARNAQEVQTALAEGFVRGLEIDYIDPEGRITPVEIAATAVAADEGITILSLCRDVTERKQAQKMLEDLNARLQAQVAERERQVSECTGQLEAASRELEALAFSISHDLRAALGAINSCAAILQREYAAGLPQEALACLEGIDKSARKMEQLFDNLRRHYGDKHAAQ